ncbi:hypothetical protein O6H91_08G075500 [Diphasiastrum complanatum]|uniref:Uncharacterized protein n=1 Tax=Diphasiastrum complanatum TaxID=34168 RepID=A0ACC2CZ24_DIPCM|nr:hypothetical protein O6H91_08G075500 [Diphasiastrum complanatum]
MEILLAPLQAVTNGNARWEEMAAAARLADKRLKIRRNRKWRQRKRHKAAELHRKKQEHFERADFEADNWRARELAKDIAKRQMEKMKEVAERKAKEERLRLEEELEQVLLVEKLQELRALRIQKLKKQGRFFPEEDNQFMERVQAAVEEEERQAAAAADTSAAALAIASAEEASRTAKTVISENVEDHGIKSQDLSLLKKYKSDQKEALPSSQKTLNPNAAQDYIPKAHLTKGAPLPDSFCGLPAEYYHYYYGSSTDIGTLIEVRRNWDTFIMQGGR